MWVVINTTIEFAATFINQAVVVSTSSLAFVNATTGVYIIRYSLWLIPFIVTSHSVTILAIVTITLAVATTNTTRPLIKFFTTYNIISNIQYHMLYPIIEYLRSNIQYLISNIQYLISYIQYLISNIEYPISNTQHIISNM